MAGSVASHILPDAAVLHQELSRWCDNDVWEHMHQHFVDDPGMQHLLIDSTVIRAHPCGAGALKKHGGQAAQALGRSRGGFSTKIHASVDALGNPLRFTLTGGQRHDIIQADALIEGYESDFLIADCIAHVNLRENRLEIK
jgi:transposase